MLSTDERRELCLGLMRASSEDEAIGLLRNADLWEQVEAWRYIDDHDGNWSTVGNQQSDPIAALTEKVVNAIDARLLNACIEAGVDPKGPHAPRSLREAVAQFFEHAPNAHADHVGRISAWLDPDIRAHARCLTLATSGFVPAQGAPCLSIADVGEGQVPDAFPDTFMSIRKRNKVDIPFVQGKFNMGGTGALYFCGTQKLQLIVSRRNQDLLGPAPSDRDHEWGFTVTRREATGARSSVFTYLAPMDIDEPRRGSVMSFSSDTLGILPEATRAVRDAHSREAAHGTLVKLFEYDISPRSNVVFTRKGLRQKIETQLPELALPLGVFECRRGFKGEQAGSYFTPARGTSTRLEQEKNEELLEFDPIGGVLNLDGDEIHVTAYAFRRRSGQKKQDGFLADYAQGGGVLYTVNGQTHDRVGQQFFTRKSVDLDYLKDDLLVTVDCSAVDEITREDLFMNSRDRHRDTPRWKQLEGMVETFLRRNEELRALALKRREEAVREKTEDNRALADLLGKVLEATPDLAKLLLSGVRLPAPFPRGGAGKKNKARSFRGKRFPTYFHFEKHKADDEYKRRAELGREVRTVFTTDATNDYFGRKAERGTMVVTLRGDDEPVTITGSSLALYSGVARWSAALPANARVGDVFAYEFVVNDATQTQPFVNRMTVEVVRRSERSGGKGRRRHRSNEGQGDHESEDGLALPEVIPVRRDEWQQHEFDEHTALVVRRSGTGSSSNPSSYDFFYNVDNDSLLRAQKEDPAESELLRERFRCGLVLVGLALISEAKGNGSRRGNQETTVQEFEQLVATATRAIAPILLPMTEMIGALSVAPSD